VSTIQTDFDLRDVKMQGGDFAQKDLAVKVNNEVRNDIVVRSYMTYCGMFHEVTSASFTGWRLISLQGILIMFLKKLPSKRRKLATRKSTVVFAVDIAHLETLTEVFRKYGYDARGLSSKTSDDERAQLLRDFRDRKFPIIVNCGILTEGTGNH
jgi:ATP-dependent helicase IRC3